MKHGAVPAGLGVKLTPLMLAMLMEHAIGPRKTRASARELRTLYALRDRGLIYFNRLTRPTRTTANVRGREIIAAIQQMKTGGWLRPTADQSRPLAPPVLDATA
jgi:hypothetical protein